MDEVHEIELSQSPVTPAAEGESMKVQDDPSQRSTRFRAVEKATSCIDRPEVVQASGPVHEMPSRAVVELP
jgi:hypothetical protein